MKKIALMLALLAFPLISMAAVAKETKAEREVRVTQEKQVKEAKLAQDRINKQIKHTDNFIAQSIDSIKPGTLATIRSLDRIQHETITKLDINDEKWIEYKVDLTQSTVWYRFKKDASEVSLISRLDVRGNKFKLPEGVRIGSSHESIIKAFGAPRIEMKDGLKYCGELPDNCVTFHLNKERTVKVISILSN
jgi:hypothetical protein